jgi:TolB-like protein/Tfp pilus assembly protein PilF
MVTGELHHAAAGDARPSEADVREHLRHVLASKNFEATDRNRRFLAYVVDETLAGRGDRIKAYSIALAVFNRPPEFDAMTDPIVRIEAGRLRRSLAHYYLTAGKDDSIRIEIPKGSYFAVFTTAAPAIPTPAGEPDSRMLPAAEERAQASGTPTQAPTRSRGRSGAWLAAAGVAILCLAWAIGNFRPLEDFFGKPPQETRIPSIVVVPFDDISPDATHAFVARGLTYELIAELTRFNELLVFGPETSFALSGKDNAIAGAKSLNSDYILAGSVYATDSTVNVSVILTDARRDQSVWSWSGERDLTTASLASIESDVAGHVVGAVAQPFGIVFDRTAKEIATKPSEDLSSYECVVRARQVWRSGKKDDFESVQACLEATIAAEPGYAKAHSNLALLYVDAYRFRFGSSAMQSESLQQALQHASRAIELEPNSTDGYLALSMAQWFSKDVDKAIETARQGLALNPLNTDLLGELGFRYAMLAKWDQGLPLIEEAYARNPRGPPSYRIAMSLHAYMQGDYRKAAEEALKVDKLTTIYPHTALAMAYAQLGEKDKAAAEVKEMLKIDPAYGDHVVEDLEKRNVDRSIIAAILDGLAKAGMTGASFKQ